MTTTVPATPSTPERMTAGQQFTKSLNEFIHIQMAQGISMEHVIGAFKLCEMFLIEPARLNAERQAQAMFKAQFDSQNASSDAP